MNMNSELVDKSHWDEESILDRSGRMARLIAECWPGPNSNEWSL